MASNAAELIGVSYSDPIIVDLTPPEIIYVYEGRLHGMFYICVCIALYFNFQNQIVIAAL